MLKFLIENPIKYLELERFLEGFMKVMLVQDLKFQTFDQTIELKAGEFIYVDMKTNIAYHNGIHFQISTFEYCIAV